MNKANKMVLGYIERYFTGMVTEADAKAMTHVNVGFGRIPDDLSIHVDQLQFLQDGMMEQMKAWNPDIKMILSLASTEPNAWTVGSSTPENRKKLADRCAEICVQYGFDGVDLDWEYPCVPSNGINSSPNDKQNFTLLLRDIRKRLDEIPGDKYYLLTIAAGADTYFCRNVEMDKIVPYLDYINVMTYELKCGFHALAGHHTALYTATGDYFGNSCDQALKMFVDYGVPKEKLVMGSGMYCRMWEDVPDKNHGFLQLTPAGARFGGPYSKLKAEKINKNGYTRYWDEECQAAWLYNPEEKVFISYEDEQSLTAKCKYIKDEGYLGIFFWELDDDPERELLAAINKVFNE